MGRMMEEMKQTYEEPKRAATGRLTFNVNKTKIIVKSRCNSHTERKLRRKETRLK
jgi:hypothetical protein